MLSKPLVKALRVVACILRLAKEEALSFMTWVIRPSLVLSEALVVLNIT